MPLELLRSDLKDYQSASNLQFNEQIKELIAKGGNIYHFGFGESPFPVPECFREGLVRSAHRNEYLSVQGLLPLREKIIRFHKQFGDFDHFSPNQLVLGTGSKELIYHIMNVFGGGQLAISQGDPALPKLIVLNSPNNPTGAVYNEQQLRDIAQVCRKYNVVVLSDEIYARTATVPFNSIAKYYSEGTIVTTGFSKWASLGGWRAGYALFPPELGRLQEAVTSAGSHSFTCQAAPVQHALSFGLDHLSELEDYIKRTRTVLSMTGTYCH
ncbi:Calcium-binding mitochondrial carrier protein Aralar1, partial [Aphelenchoides avenae]